KNYLPNFDVPAPFTLDEYFEHVVREGFKERLQRLQQLAAAGALRHTIDEYERRLSYELAMIKQMKYPGYFLIVWDFIRYAREQGEPLRQMEQNDPKVRELLSVARRLEGMTRHASVHAAGVVIAPKPVTEYAPLYKGARDEITTQWSMNEIERIGLLKMDFLGLSTLTLIYDAIQEIERTTGTKLDIDTIPLDDGKTYQIFQDGQTYGIFQFESSGMRDILRKSKPQRLDDLIALNALYRPGPLRSGMVDDYIARKQGKTEVKYELPELEPILADTYGVIAYQEQVMRISNVLAGFTLGEADILRRA